MPIIVGSGGSGANPLALFDAMDLVLGCVCGEMATLADSVEDYPGCPCRAYVSAGAPTGEGCCAKCTSGAGGELTVHLVDFFESENFPVRSPAIHPCGAASAYVALVAVTAARCAPSADSRGTAPSVERLTEAARVRHADVLAIVRALTCCLPGIPVVGKRKRRVSLGQVTATDPTGGCAMTVVLASVEVGQVCGCADGGS